MTYARPLAVVGLVFLLAVSAAAAINKRVVLVLPYDVSALAREEAWVGEGIAQAVALAFAQHPGFIQIERERLHGMGEPEKWGDAAVLQAARAVRADAVVFGSVQRGEGGTFVINPRYVDLKAGADPVSLEAVPVADGELLKQLGLLPALYARALKISLTDSEAARFERAARPTGSLRAFELYVRGRMAALRGTQEGNEAASDLLVRAADVDSSFVVAQYALGTVHHALGNRWKAAAQFRASTQLDPTYPEPYKALGDLFLAAPRRLFDQAVEAYGKAIELRPFFAEAHVGLGDAKAAKGDVDGAIAAYQKALVHNPMNPRVHMSLGKIYYAEKNLYYESVNAYKRAIDLDSRFVDAHMGLGEVYEDKGLYREAIGQYRKVVELDEKHTGALYNLALVYEKVDPREAIVQWERYIALASQLPSEKDWVDVARQHLRKLKGQIKD
jgi:tetratricopeptide (TPR) repeat protein/TolB-like protein